MITIHWNPAPHLGPIPINWYGLTWVGGFLAGGALVRQWAARVGVSRQDVENIVLWILVGSMIGARLYYIVQNEPLDYLLLYTNPNSYAPTDGVARHPDQAYELVGDLIIAAILLRARRRVSDGNLFLLYLVLFSVLRFGVFFVRGNAPIVALGLKNGQWTAIAIFVVALCLFLIRWHSRERISTV